jgi:hypothetical protein
MFRSGFRNFHWVTTVSLVLALAPLGYLSRVPLRYYFWGYLSMSGKLAFQSLALAMFLWVVSEPRTFWRKLTVPGPRIPFPKAVLAAIFIPALYFIFGFILVLSYNDIIAALRFDGRTDAFLEHVDAWLLMGGNVRSWAHWTYAHYPWSLKWIQHVYFVMFSLMGACIAILGASEGLRRSMQFVAAILSAYYIALFLFFLIPATGPYFLDHSTLWPRDSLISMLQTTYAAHLPEFRAGYRPQKIGADYFLAFPCMHIVQPLIVLWFLRRRRTLAWIVGIYSVVLIPCILLLEEHYVVDIIGGVAVALLATAMVEGRFVMLRPSHAEGEYRYGPSLGLEATDG